MRAGNRKRMPATRVVSVWWTYFIHWDALIFKGNFVTLGPQMFTKLKKFSFYTFPPFLFQVLCILFFIFFKASECCTLHLIRRPETKSVKRKTPAKFCSRNDQLSLQQIKQQTLKTSNKYGCPNICVGAWVQGRGRRRRRRRGRRGRRRSQEMAHLYNY